MTPERIEEQAEFVEKFGKLPGHMALELLAAESKPMIPWIKYDEYDRGIESHVTHLVISENGPQLAQHAKLIDRPGYGWHRFGGYRVHGVTHWAPINLPGEEDNK